MATYIYPENAELQEIAQEKVNLLTAEDPLNTIMPMVNSDSHVLQWEQEDNYVGLQQVRGLNGQPGRVKNVGGSKFTLEPGVYGEFMTIDETELTVRRQWGSFNAPIDLTELVMRKQDQLLARRIDRWRYIGWALIAAGTFSVASPDGATIHTDTYPLQTHDASTWATANTATPLLDFRNAKLKQRGKGVSFGAQARAFMNQTTFNNMIANTNSADLAGKRTAGLATVLGLADVNAVLLQEDLPRIEIYDEGYLDDSGVFQLFLPTGTVVIVGRRPGGQTIADYAMTRNVNNPGFAPGPYQKVIDKGEEDVPRQIIVHDGHNGGPRIYYPSALVRMDVS